MSVEIVCYYIVAMYIRTKTFKNKDGSTRTYLQIVSNERVNGKPTQRVVANLGRLEELQENEVIDKMISGLTRYSNQEWIKAQVKELRADWGKEWGPGIIFRSLWDDIGIGEILRHILCRTKIENNLAEATFAMVLNRLSDPRSKLGVDTWMDKVYQPSFESLKLRHLYQALDFLADNKDEIEEAIFSRIRNLFNLKLDLVLWDTTSTYFESNDEDELRRYGYSKDHRPDRIQIVIGVLMTAEGIPVAHEVFPGNTADITTFKSVIENVRQRFNLNRVILVGDRGMVSDKVLESIEEAGLEYIVGVKMRQVKRMNDVLSRAGRYSIVKDNLKVKEVIYEGKRYVVCLNPEEAERDQRVRSQVVNQLEAKIAHDGIKSLIGNSAYKRFLKIEGAKPGIDQKKVKEEEIYDGKYVILTNNQSMSTSEVALAYKELWRVERAFREMKSGLDLRPVFHWKDRRIRGHVMVCFLAFLLESSIKRKIAKAGVKIKYAALIDDLKQLQAIQVRSEGVTYLARTELVGNAYEAFRALGIRPPNRLQSMS